MKRELESLAMPDDDKQTLILVIDDIRAIEIRIRKLVNTELVNEIADIIAEGLLVALEHASDEDEIFN